MEDELSAELNRYNFLIQIFEKVNAEIEEELKDSNQWFAFCFKIGKKFLNHIYSMVFHVSQDLLNLQIDSVSISSKLDTSSINANLRIQFDTYSTFYHLLIHDGTWEEKIVRFRLWQLDSMITTLNVLKNNDEIKLEKENIDHIANMIQEFDYYKKLTTKQKTKLLKKGKENSYLNANWKFDTLLLSSEKKKFNWDDLMFNTGIKKEIYYSLYELTSMHIHPSFYSIYKINNTTEKDKHAIKIVGLRISSFLICFYIDDLCSRFNSAKKYIETLSINEREIVASFLKEGRDANKIKYFT